MALFKISKGLSLNLPQEKTAGYCWYTTDDSLFYIDYKDENGEVQRKALNGKDAETLTGASLSTILNSNNLEIPTSKAVYDAIKNLADTVVGESLEGQTLTLSDGSTVTASEGAEIFNDYRTPTYNSYSFMSEGNIASGAYSHAEGSGNLASGDKSHAEGIQVVASGEGSHAEGYRAKATGLYSHAEGVETVASGIYSHAEGQKTQATDSNAHAEGQNTIASGRDSHAEGGRDTQIRDANGNVMSTTSAGYASHAEGVGTLAGGSASHAEGRGTIAASKNQHAQGKFNIEDAEEKYAHITGNGSSSSVRSNAHTLDWSGNAWFAGDVKVGGIGMDDTEAKLLATTDYVDDSIAAIDYDAKGSADSALASAKEYTDTALASAKEYTDTKVSGLASTSSVDTSISTHDTSTSAHSDIRDLITELTTRLNTLADSDDTTLDQMSEIVEYIKSNKDLIDTVTTSKVNVSDIVDNLTTNVADKPLSAAQGVAIKALIDTLDAELDAKAASEHTHAISDVTNLQTTLDAKVPTSRTINGKALTANITLSASDVGADASGSANTALASAKSYADSGDATTLSSAKTYTDTSIANMELITVEDIDTICGSSIVAASEVTF